MAPRTTSRRLVTVLALAGLVLALVAAPAHATIFGPRPARSPNAEDIRTAYWVAIAIGAILIVAVHAFLIAAVVRFRARRGRTPQHFAAGSGAFLRPAAPLVAIAVGLFVFGIVMMTKTREVAATGSEGLSAERNLVAQVNGLSIPPDSKAITINAIGQRWLWRFEYPTELRGLPIFSYGQLVVPVDTTILLNVSSTDVTHRWFVPALGGQVDAVPGHPAETWFRADRVGTFEGQSTSFSGTSYATMRAWVDVVTPQAYEQFLDRKTRELKAAQDFIERSAQEGSVPGAALP